MNIAATAFLPGTQVYWTTQIYGEQRRLLATVKPQPEGLRGVRIDWRDPRTGQLRESQVPLYHLRAAESILQDIYPSAMQPGDLVNPWDWINDDPHTRDRLLNMELREIHRRQGNRVKVLEVGVFLTLDTSSSLGKNLRVLRRDCKTAYRAAGSVLGDSIEEPPTRKIDALGRGLKGHGHGSIAWKECRRKRKSGKVVTYKQAWYQWEDPQGKHCRYLKSSQVSIVRRLIDEGRTVDEILGELGKSRTESKGKTR